MMNNGHTKVPAMRACGVVGVCIQPRVQGFACARLTKYPARFFAARRG
jgi:hypothetical protein